MAIAVETMARERIHPAAWGCMLYILVAVGRLPELLPALAPFHVGKIAVALALLGILIGPPATGRGVWSTPMGRLVLVLSVLAALSITFSIWRSYSLNFLLSNFLSSIIVFFVIVRTAKTRRMIALYLGALLCAGGLLALMALLADGAGRIAVSTSYDPNDLALVLVTLLPLAVTGVFALRGFARIGILALAAGMLMVILLTGSRGGFLGLLVVAGYLLLARFPTARGGLTRRFNPVKFAVIGAGALLLAVTVPPATWERMATIGSVGDDYNVTAEDGRIAIWKRGLSAMGQRPVGYGLATFGSVEGQHGGGRYQSAHNSWIQIGVELGIPGALVLAALYMVALRHLRALRLYGQPRLRGAAGRTSPAALLHAGVAVGLRGCLLGFLVTSFFLSAAYSTLLFALFAIIAASYAHALGSNVETASVTTQLSKAPDSKQAPDAKSRWQPAAQRSAHASPAKPRHVRAGDDDALLLQPRTPDVRRYWRS